MSPTNIKGIAGKIVIPLDLLLFCLARDSIVVSHLIYKQCNQVHYGTSSKTLVMYLYCQLL